MTGRRGEILLFYAGALGVLIALGHLSTRHPLRFDLTATGRHSLAPATIAMLERLAAPVHIVLFHDPLMRETVELYRRVDEASDRIEVEYHDPTLNPARARQLGVQFAGTAVMTSEDRTLKVHGQTEADVANGILRVSRGAEQRLCFLDGHREADPFSRESHDHAEGSAGHTHGLGAQYVLHERHGLAKARGALETLGYLAESVTLAGGGAGASGGDRLESCAALVVAGPKIPLLPAEIATLRRWLRAGGNALLLIDPFVATGLDSVVREYGVVLDPDIVIDPASHFWSDPSAPAVTQFNRHAITRELPLVFFPGARSLSPTPERVPGTRVVPLANASVRSYGETDRRRAERDPAQDLPGPRTLAVVASRRPLGDPDTLLQELERARPSPPANPEADDGQPVSAPSRIVVIGDSDFATNSFFHLLGNGNLFLNAVTYLTGQEDLIGLEPRTYDLPRLAVTNRQMKAAFVIAVLLVPAGLAVAGSVVWWRQR